MNVISFCMGLLLKKMGEGVALLMVLNLEKARQRKQEGKKDGYGHIIQKARHMTQGTLDGIQLCTDLLRTLDFLTLVVTEI